MIPEAVAFGRLGVPFTEIPHSRDGSVAESDDDL
jgi:hypothetical protein